jgi:sirohydrochlorin ferrochelatase
MNKYTHDLRGNPVDGTYWLLLEDALRQAASTFRSAGNDRAAEIAERLVETADDVPAELVQEQMSFWQEDDDGEHAKRSTTR